MTVHADGTYVVEIRDSDSSAWREQSRYTTRVGAEQKAAGLRDFGGFEARVILLRTSGERSG